MPYARPVRRSIPATLWLLGCFTAAVTLATVAAHELASDPYAAFQIRTRRDPTALHWAGALAAAIALDLERRTRRELLLAGNGATAEAVIEDVERIAWRTDWHVARYTFRTAAGTLATGSCAIGDVDALVLQPGSRVNVYYDPARPEQSVMQEGLRLVAVGDAAGPVTPTPTPPAPDSGRGKAWA